MLLSQRVVLGCGIGLVVWEEDKVPILRRYVGKREVSVAMTVIFY